MTKKITILFIVFLIFCFKPVLTQANHFAGGEITFKSVGGFDYLVTLTFYRDCGGPNITTPITLNFNCPSNGNYNFNASLQLQSQPVNLTKTCIFQPSACDGGTNFSVEEYVFQATVNLVPCSNWKISYSAMSFPRSLITAISSGSNVFLPASFNSSLAPGNSSPVFNSKPKFIIPINKNINLDISATDLEGDSLVYSLYNPLSLENTPITYILPYSYSNFLISSNSVSINSQTGIINLTPINNASSIYGVKIMEYRKINNIPTLISTIHREVIIKTEIDYNSIPILGGINLNNNPTYNANDTIYEIQACANKVITFNICGYDADTFNTSITGGPETFDIFWNSGIAQANFQSFNQNTDSAYANFYWLPNTSHISNNKYCFIAKIVDNNCPYKGSSERKYCIKVVNDFNLTTKINDTLIKLPNSLVLSTGNYYSIVWKNINGNVISTNQTATITQSGTYILQVSNGICFDSDTFNVTFNLGFNESSKNLISLSQNYPNPAKDYTLIDVELAEASNTSIQITDICGRKILEKDFGKIPDGKSTLEIPLVGIAPGLYFYTLVIGNERISKKMVKE